MAVPADASGVNWKLSIRNARHRIGIILKDNPSLGPQIQGMIAEVYPAARLDAIDETGLPEDSFPDTCAYTVDQLIDQAFLPIAA